MKSNLNKFSIGINIFLRYGANLIQADVDAIFVDCKRDLDIEDIKELKANGWEWDCDGEWWKFNT